MNEQDKRWIDYYERQAKELDGFPGTRGGLELIRIIHDLEAQVERLYTQNTDLRQQWNGMRQERDEARAALQRLADMTRSAAQPEGVVKW